jgi:DNA-binding NarL/FixJ family response regulator
VEINSPYWTRLALSFLALVYIHENEREQAAAALSRAEEPDARLESRAQKTCHAIRLKLALSGGDFDDAYRLGSQLLEAVMTASPESRQPGQGVPRLLMWYGETLTGLKRYPQAESTLIAALQVAEAQGALPLVWRSHRALARLYRAQRHFDASEYELLAAQAIVEHLAATLQDDALRQTFQEYTLADLPLQHSSRREAKRAFDGLTRREQEIAALVGQGRSNREIATALTLSERTVETHISNILTKLGFVRRAQIIAWAVEKGLAAP